MEFDKLILDWNYKFRCDRAWRKKYNIPFGSKLHLEANQIDIFFDIREDRLIEKIQLSIDKRRKDLQEYNDTGKFLSDQEADQEAEERLFKKYKARK